MNMKTNILPLIAFLAAIATVAILPVSATAASILFTVTGLLSTMVLDYGRSSSPVLVPSAPILPFAPSSEVALQEAA